MFRVREMRDARWSTASGSLHKDDDVHWRKVGQVGISGMHRKEKKKGGVRCMGWGCARRHQGEGREACALQGEIRGSRLVGMGEQRVEGRKEERKEEMMCDGWAGIKGVGKRELLGSGEQLAESAQWVAEGGSWDTWAGGLDVWEEE